MDIFTFFLTLFSLVGVWLNIKKNRGCFFIWIITNTKGEREHSDPLHKWVMQEVLWVNVVVEK